MTRIDGDGTTEAAHQMALIAAREYHRKQYPVLDLLRGSADGEKRDHTVNARGVRYSPTGVKLKRMGVQPDWPDLQCPVARKGYHGWWGEMKKPGESPRPGQLAMMDRLRREGHYVCWYDQWPAMWNDLINYLELPTDLLVL
jgi:hypothetical protein